MGEIRIKIEEDSLLTRISDLAQANKRSVEDEVKALLQTALPAPRVRREDLRALAQSIAAETPKGVKQTDSVEILREIRGN
jgi:plasmid stability protein